MAPQWRPAAGLIAWSTPADWSSPFVERRTRFHPPLSSRIASLSSGLSSAHRSHSRRLHVRVSLALCAVALLLGSPPPGGLALSACSGLSRKCVLEATSMLSPASSCSALPPPPLCRSLAGVRSARFRSRGVMLRRAEAPRSLAGFVTSLATQPLRASPLVRVANAGRLAGAPLHSSHLQSSLRMQPLGMGLAGARPFPRFACSAQRSFAFFQPPQNASREGSDESTGGGLAPLPRECAARGHGLVQPFEQTQGTRMQATSLKALGDDAFSSGASSSAPASGRSGGPLRHAELCLNRVTLIGRLGTMPEIRQMSNGEKFAWFSMATSVNWIDKATGDAQSRTEWHRIVIYDDALVDLVDKYLHTGRRVFVEGKLQTRRWTGADGVDRYSTSVVVSRAQGELIILDAPSSSSHAHSCSSAARQQTSTSDWADDGGEASHRDGAGSTSGLFDSGG
ncbi:single-strand binding protein [Besnoitia besnoiti]|uniref:Single-strand binding protein n=1 Tax=Besnoitia besnoiti TaxID=94643 RepID=A0A2A9MC82_BESBE|nr:single-strand binding protein [Besnoitia besnoiti]PFH35479.1 single-strand binding protein [Besnoitia besnoiti]